MASFNKIIILGYLGKDPETRYLPDGTAVCSFSVATTEKFKKGNDWQEKTCWFKVNVWGKQGEACAQYLAKGAQVYVDGRLSVSEFTDRDGNQRTGLEVRANDVQFLDRKPQGDSDAQSQARAASATQANHQALGFGQRDDDQSVPF
jgi:single-strand DNA-binding protein